jgi:hypothetical protein
MWIVLEMADLRFAGQAYQKAAAVVQQMNGSVVEAGTIFEMIVVANLPHRKYRAVENAVAVAVKTLPVKRTAVYPRNPYAPSKPLRRRNVAEQEQEGKACIDVLFEGGGLV